MSEANDLPDEWDEELSFDAPSDSEELDAVSPQEDDVVFTTDEGVELNLSRPALTTEEARELTNYIRSTADTLYVLIARAHAGKAWEALGYASFAAYVKEEFDMSRSRAYQLLNQSKIIEAITAAAPEGTEVQITEAAARDLKSIIGSVTGEVEERTKNLNPDDAGAVIEDLVRAERERMREANDLGDAFSLDEELAADQADRDGFSASSMGSGLSNGNYDGPRFGDVEDGALDDEDDLSLEEMDSLLTFENEDPQEVRRNYDAVYVLYTVLGMMKDLPPVEGVIAMIPAERRVQVESSITAPVEWLNAFAEQWKQQEWRQDITQSEESSDESDDDEADSDSDFVNDPEVEDIFEEFEK